MKSQISFLIHSSLLVRVQAGEGLNLRNILFILPFLLIQPVCAKNLNTNYDGNWICTDSDAPGISAWDTESLKGMLDNVATIKNGQIKFAINNKGEDYVQKFDLFMFFPGKVMQTLTNRYFDPTDKGTLDPKRFKFSDQVIEFKTDAKYVPYIIVFDNSRKKMILAWEGGYFLYVPNRTLKK